jgi:hypothetical protein
MNVALCTFFCVQSHIHTLPGTPVQQRTSRTRGEGHLGQRCNTAFAPWGITADGAAAG